MLVVGQATRANASGPPSCHASSPQMVRTTVPSGLVTGLPGEMRFPTSTARRTAGSRGVSTLFSTSSMPARLVGGAPENRWYSASIEWSCHGEVGLQLYHRVASGVR